MSPPTRHEQPAASGGPADAETVAQRIVRSSFAVRGGELVLGGLPVSQLARRYGTPLFVYVEDVLAKQWQALRATLPPEFQVYFSMKANPHQAFLRFFANLGCGLEVASGGELAQALAVVEPAQVLFAGPGKTDEELSAAVAAGIGEIHVESVGELQRLDHVARRQNSTVRVALRINPRQSAEGGAMRMGGRPAPFGVDEEQVDVALDGLRQCRALQLTGVHLFAGTQILDARVLINQFQHAIQVARSVSDAAGQPLETIDFGGGWGVPYFPHEVPLDLQYVRDGLNQLHSEVRGDPRLRTARLVVEPGRFLVAEAGIYVARVVDAKVSRGMRFLVLDGGMHHHLAASGNLGQVIKRNYPIAVLNRLDEPPQHSVQVVGPLCTPLDTLARDLPVPQVQVGDLVGVFQSGAYARTASPLGFLSHPAPPEVWVRQGEAHRIRRRGCDADFLADQTVPASAAQRD